MNCGLKGKYMHPKDLTICAVSLHGAPIRYTTEANLVPFCAYATTLNADKRQQLKNEGWSFDDTGENISHLNPWFAELTAIFSIVYHDKSDLIGNAQHRRRWQEKMLAPSDENVLYVPKPAIFNISLADQMRQGHASFDGVTMIMNATEASDFPLNASIMEKVLQQNHFHGCLMARGPEKYYKTFMKTLLDCMNIIWQANSEKIMMLTGYDRRAIAFMAERVMTALILCRESLFDFEIMTAPIKFIGP
jgi:hypothetical protein